MAAPRGFTEAEGRFVFAQIEAGAAAAAVAERMEPPRTAREVQAFIRAMRKQHWITSLSAFEVAAASGRFRDKPADAKKPIRFAPSLPERQKPPSAAMRVPGVAPVKLPHEAELRRIIDAYPDHKIIRCPKPERPEYDSAWDLPSILRRQKRLGMA